MNVGDLGGADALPTGPMMGAAATATPTTSADVAKRLANVATTTTTTSVAPGWSVAQGLRPQKVAAAEEPLRQSERMKRVRGLAVRPAAAAVTPKTTPRFRHRTELPIPVATISQMPFLRRSLIGSSTALLPNGRRSLRLISGRLGLLR